MNARKTVIRFAAFAATVFCGPAALFAAEVAPADARRAAQTWVGLGRSMGKLPADRAVAAVDEIEDPATGARLLVAKFEGGGFVVMSADDLVDPVISFSATGDGVVVDDSNPYWTLLRGDIAAREAAAGVVRGLAASSGTPSRLLAAAPSAPTAAQRKWAELLGESVSGSRAAGAALLRAAGSGGEPDDLRVDSFVASRWNQSTHNNYADGQNCYNYYTPNNYVCGCVATVGAQIMRYWQYPTATVAPQTFTCAVDGVSADYTMMGGVYDWASMPLVPSDDVTEAQCQAIGKLTYDIGVSVGMKWKSGGSSSGCYDLARQLPAVFGYATAVPAWYIDGYYAYSLEEVKKAVIPNCDARAPVAMSIERVDNGSTYGHAVLVDGYGYSADDFYMHVNFGWGGGSDAWYMPPNIKNYSTIKGFVFNVFPSSTGSILSGRVLDASGEPIAGAPVMLKRNATTVGTTTTDAHGIYAFVAAAGSYLVSAAAGGESAVVGAEVAETVGTRLAEKGYYFSTASIGNSYDNDIRITGIAGVTPPVFSPDSCLFYPSTNVAITCADAGAEIRYTLDGSEPVATSTLYTGPIFVDDTVTIKARAFAAGMNPSPVVGATYTYDAAQGAPKGDYFDNPINISGASGSYVIDDNSAYTVEDGEPWHTLENGRYYYQYHTVWYKWTAPGSGTMTFATKMTHYRGGTFVAVYTGDELATINRIGFSDEYDSDYWTRVTVEVTKGVTYRIVGMSSGDQYTEEFTLSWSGDQAVAQSPYETWATERGLGAPGEVTAGVENVFRYVFGKPTEAFSPIASVGRDASGRIVLALPAVVNTEGVTLSVLSTPDITNWSPPVAEERSLTLGADGAVRFEDFDSVRFYRLRAEVQAP